MKWRYNHFMYILLIGMTGAANAGFIEKADFPKTINDVDFNSRIENEAAGYAPFKDASAYLSIELQSVNEALTDEIAIMEKEHELYCILEGRNKPECQEYEPQTDDNSETQAQNQDETPQQPSEESQQQSSEESQQPFTTPNKKPQQPTGQPGTYCGITHPHIPAGQTMPLGVPVSPDLPIYKLAQEGKFCSGYGGVRGYKKSTPVYHEGVDIGCAMGGKTAASYHGTPIFATADGIVRSVSTAKQCKSAGNMISITHADGFVSYYMHLDSILVKQGQQIKAGCQIGTMGHTGGARVSKCPSMGIDLTHLHYQVNNKKHPQVMKTPNGNIKLHYINNSLSSLDPADLMKKTN